MDKILFLDVDGVLNTTRSLSIYSLSRPCLRRLGDIVEETGCKIILSSMWRLIPEARARLVKTLYYRGISIQGDTPYLSGSRGREIKEYIVRQDLREGKFRYAILDDDSDMLKEQLPHFFQTDPDFGLTDNIAYRVAYHLNEGRYFDEV